jgi:hypothetical protein
MNIFVLDRSPERAARYHCDRHVVKMVLETGQLLSTQIWKSAESVAQKLHQQGALYLPTHRKHPCARWAGESLGNFLWLCRLGSALAREYSYRYAGKTHASAAIVETCQLLANGNPRQVIQSGSTTKRLTPFALAMPEAYKTADPVMSYRLFYAKDKIHFCTWTGRRTPKWFRDLTRLTENTG